MGARTCADSLSVSAPGANQIQDKIRELVRPSPPDQGAPMGSEPVGDYQRKTQSPLVWLNLHKASFPQTAPAWYNLAYVEEAKQRLGEMAARLKQFGVNLALSMCTVQCA